MSLYNRRALSEYLPTKLENSDREFLYNIVHHPKLASICVDKSVSSTEAAILQTPLYQII